MHDFIQYGCYPLYVMGNFPTERFCIKSRYIFTCNRIRLPISAVWKFPVTYVKPDKFNSRVSSQPDCESIGLGYIAAGPNLKLVGSGGNIFKPDPTVDWASSSRNLTEEGLGRAFYLRVGASVDSDWMVNRDPTRPADITVPSCI